MKIKRFFELFDTDDMKSQHEIDYLSGNFRNLGQKVERDFKNEDIGAFIRKIADWHFPFFKAFEDAVQEDSAQLDLEGFSVYISRGDDDFWSFVAHSKKHAVILGVKVNEVNKYDIYIYLDNAEAMDDENQSPGFELNGLDYNTVVEKIKGIYVPFIKEAGFEKLFKYNSEAANLNN
jgi:hypothetical protein